MTRKENGTFVDGSRQRCCRLYIKSDFCLHLHKAYILTRGGFTIEFSEMRGPNKIFGSFISQNEPNILFGPLISENSIIKPPLSDVI